MENYEPVIALKISCATEEARQAFAANKEDTEKFAELLNKYKITEVRFVVIGPKPNAIN